MGWYHKGHRIALDVVKGLCFLHSRKVRTVGNFVFKTL